MKKLLWALLILAIAGYCIVVYGWIKEGDRHFEQQRSERMLDKR